MHAPRTRNGLTILCRHDVGTHQGNERTRNSPWNMCVCVRACVRARARVCVCVCVCVCVQLTGSNYSIVQQEWMSNGITSRYWALRQCQTHGRTACSWCVASTHLRRTTLTVVSRRALRICLSHSGPTSSQIKSLNRTTLCHRRYEYGRFIYKWPVCRFSEFSCLIATCPRLRLCHKYQGITVI